MPQTRISCPRCRQPVTANIEQLFDLNVDPQAKQRLLSGSANMINCPNCGYQGSYPTPIVYHDPAKELLLTFFPPELGLPVNEQERLLGPMINQVVNKLPNEKRKGYLLRPQSMFTFQTLMEKILEADGITKEMLDSQQKRLNLLQRLLAAPAPSRPEIIKNEDALIDESFFSMLNRLIEASLAGGSEQTARQMVELQETLLKESAIGQKIKAQAEETQAAVAQLQEASKKGLTRESLLDMLVNAPSETRLTALVSLARSGLDYQFFQTLSDRIERARGDERTRLTDLRTRLVDMTRAIDEEVKKQMEATRTLLEEILKESNVEEAVEKRLPSITQLFVDLAAQEMEKARQEGNRERLQKLQSVMNVLQKASAPPPEYALLEELLGAQDEDARQKLLKEHAAEVTPEFLQLVTGLIAQGDGQEPELLQQLEAVHRSTLRFSMQANLNK